MADDDVQIADAVRDDDGVPIIVFHGTGKDFESFDMGVARENAIFFSADAHEAYKFAGDGGYIVEAQLLMRNPMVVRGDAIPMHHEPEDIMSLVAEARSGGHDGVFIRGFRDNQRQEIDTWMVFDPDNVRILRRRHACDVRNEDLRARWK